METIVVTVKGVKVYVDEQSASVELILDKAIKGFAQQEDGSYAEGDVKTITMYRSRLTAQLCELNDFIGGYRAVRYHAFGQQEFGVILFNAKLTLNREFKAAGEIVDNKACERDCYITNIVKVVLTDKATKQLDDATALPA